MAVKSATSLQTCLCCNMTFSDVDLQRDHYKSEWHRYNLKRKVAQLKPISLEDFIILEAKHGQQTNEARNEVTQFVCKPCKRTFSTQKQFDNHAQSGKHVEKTRRMSGKANFDEPLVVKKSVTPQEEDDDQDWESVDSEDEELIGMPITSCLFCNYSSNDMEDNLKHMSLKHSFFLPDAEFISDVESLLTYLGQKLSTGKVCLWCNTTSKSFRSLEAVQRHMNDKGHCKMRLDPGEDMLEFADFYDYSSSYPDGETNATTEVEENVLEVNDDLELVLPSGAKIGHRSLKVYFKQNLHEKTEEQFKTSNRAIRGSMSGRHLMHQYNSLGFHSSSSPVILAKKARDHQFLQKKWMRLGIKANKLQRHFRQQVDF